MYLKRILLALASVVFGVIPCVVVIGGIDCEPIDDSDLLLPESETPYCADGNGWAVLSNLLCRVEKSWERNKTYMTSQGLLWWYADPANQEWLLPIYGVEPDYLSNFTNVQLCCNYVKKHIQTNEWVTSGINAVISSPRYAPPPPCMLTGDQFSLPISELRRLNCSFLAAELRCQIESGDFAAAIASLRRNLQLATLLQTQCGTIAEYLVGAEMIDEDISFLEQILVGNRIPSDELHTIDQVFNDLPGFSDESVSRALKREYAYLKESARIAREEGLYPGKSRLHKLLHAPLYRYVFHPNRAQRLLASEIRSLMGTNALENIPVQWEDREERHWYDVAIPNSYGRIGASVGFRRYIGRVMKIKGKVQAFQARIRKKIRAQDDECPVGEYFPLVFTNGCYYTRSLKRIIGVGGATESVVVGGDVEIIDEAHFETIKNVVIPVGCDNCLDQWFGAFRDPRNLETIAGAENHSEVGLSGGVVYDRRTNRLINILGKREVIVVPKEVVVDDDDDLDRLFNLLEENGVKRIHFCGEFPVASSWWSYKHKHWNIEVSVSRQNADERTKQIVGTGWWKGLTVCWGEP